jgi:hypothetical protein
MVADGRKMLVQLRRRLQEIMNRLLDIEARLASTPITNAPMTLRIFTEKQLNDKSPGDQEADSSSPRATTEKYSTR